jgi:hypothetical protein
MTAMDNPGVLQLIFYKLTKATAQRREAKARGMTHARTWFQSTVRFLFSIAGLGCLTLAGLTINITVGLVVAGVSFFVLSTLLTGGKSETPQPPTEPRLR